MVEPVDFGRLLPGCCPKLSVARVLRPRRVPRCSSRSAPSDHHDERQVTGRAKRLLALGEEPFDERAVRFRHSIGSRDSIARSAFATKRLLPVAQHEDAADRDPHDHTDEEREAGEEAVGRRADRVDHGDDAKGGGESA